MTWLCVCRDVLTGTFSAPEGILCILHKPFSHQRVSELVRRKYKVQPTNIYFWQYTLGQGAVLTEEQMILFMKEVSKKLAYVHLI